MNEKDAQILIKYLMKDVTATEAKYEALKAGRDDVAPWEAVDLARLRGRVDGLKAAIDLIERTVGDSE